MRLTPSTSVVSCRDTSANASLRTEVTATSALQALSMRPKPPAMCAIAGKRIQPSLKRTHAASAACAGAAITEATDINSTHANGLVIIETSTPCRIRGRSMTTLIDTINHGPIRELRLARPPVNALDTELCRALIATLNQCMAEDVQGVVLSGSERIFTGGMDVPYLLRHGEDKHKLLDSWQAFFGAARTLAESRIPVVA